MFLNTVHHVAIIVSDYELSRDFYVNKLGFEIIRENHRPERHDYKSVSYTHLTLPTIYSV